MPPIFIRKASLNDIDFLTDISRQTFKDTFSAVNTEENMKTYLEQHLSQEKLSQELLHPESDFYFAVDQNKIIGYLKINTGKAQTEHHDPNALEIERIYV